MIKKILIKFKIIQMMINKKTVLKFKEIKINRKMIKLLNYADIININY